MEASATRRIFAELDSGSDHGLNPPVSDASTFSFESAAQMHAMIQGEVPGRFIYSRHLNPSTERLGRAVAAMEGTPAGLVFSSGMAAISTTVMALCGAGDEIVASRMIYGGTYALLANFLPRFGVRTTFVDPNDPDGVTHAMNDRTKLLYCESLSNPLIEVADIPVLSIIAKERGVPLAVDNTFAPLVISPRELGADVVLLSLTKYVNGMADGLAGAVCCDEDLTARLLDLEDGPALILGGTLDGHRAASIAKNMLSLDLRMRRHARNARAVAEALESQELRVHYPGLATHPHHDRMKHLAHPGFGAGGVLAVDMGSAERADRFVRTLAETGTARIAVSLGCPRTVVTVPGTSTAAEIPEEQREAMGLTPGLVRIAAGIEDDIEGLVSGMKQAAGASTRAGVS